MAYAESKEIDFSSFSGYEIWILFLLFGVLTFAITIRIYTNTITAQYHPDLCYKEYEKANVGGRGYGHRLLVAINVFTEAIVLMSVARFAATFVLSTATCSDLNRGKHIDNAVLIALDVFLGLAICALMICMGIFFNASTEGGKQMDYEDHNMEKKCGAWFYMKVLHSLIFTGVMVLLFGTFLLFNYIQFGGKAEPDKKSGFLYL